jgi:hypothetical protein
MEFRGNLRTISYIPCPQIIQEMRGHWDFPKWASKGAGAAQVKGLYMSIKVGEGLAVGVDSMVAFKLLSRQPPPPATFMLHEIGPGRCMPLHKCDRIGPRQATELHEHGRDSRLSR